MARILRVKMGKTPECSVSDEEKYDGLGGRALTSKIILDEVPPTCHALGVENKLVIAPGMLTGSAAAISGRISVGCKSPLTGGIKEANAGGQAAQIMGRLGIRALVGDNVIRVDHVAAALAHLVGARLDLDLDTVLRENWGDDRRRPRSCCGVPN